jgi:ribose-phosphate pyrophosphokinase
MKLISCNANRPLAQRIADRLDMRLTDTEVKTFKDREVFVKVNENVRGQDVYIIQSTSAPANDHLMELLITMDALVRASARRITAVIPYFGYSRQDRKTDGRTPISAKLVANLITVAGADRVVTVDLHAAQIQGFFDRARALAKRLNTDLAIVDKRRERAGESEVANIIGDVEGRKCILIDDMTDSGGTLINAADALLKKGAMEVAAYVTHGVLSNGAAANIDKSQLKELVITDTIQASDAVAKAKKIRTITLAPLIAEAIRRIANDESISKMFD